MPRCKPTLFLLEGTDRLQEKTISQPLPNPTDLVISRQLGAIINASYYVKLHLHRISAPARTSQPEPLSSPAAHVGPRVENGVLLPASPGPADVFNALVSQNKIVSKKTEIRKGGEVNKSAAAQRKNDFALVF